MVIIGLIIVASAGILALWLSWGDPGVGKHPDDDQPWDRIDY